MKKLILLLALIMLVTTSSSPVLAEDKKELVWGGDSEGGFPYMFPNPKNTDELIGFEVDIVEALAEQMGRKPVYVNNAWENLIPGLNRKLYDISINGLEVTPEHKEVVNFSIPYYKTYLQLAVRKGDNSIKTLEDCKGKHLRRSRQRQAGRCVLRPSDSSLLRRLQP